MRSKIAKKVAALATAISIVCCLPQFSASGANEPACFKCELKTDLSKCTYSFAYNVSALYEMYGRIACAKWSGDYTLFNINWNETTKNTYTANFIMTSGLGSAPKAPYAQVKHFNNLNKEIDADTYDWTYCVVMLNSDYGNNIPQETFTHEIGHVLGLAHQNNNPNSIMCQEYYGRVATEPAYTDKASLTFKYRNRKK